MKKTILGIMTAVLVVSLLFTGCSGSEVANDQNGTTNEQKDASLDAIKEKGYLILGLDDSFPPMGYRDDKGEVVGFDIDLAKEVAKRMEVELKIQPIDWDGKVLSLNNGDIDVIWNGLTITEERKEKINFSKTYLDNRQIMIVRNDSTINTKDDLAGKKVGVQLSSSSQDALEADTETVESLDEVIKYSNNTEALLDLKAGRVDAVVADEILGRYYIGKRPDDYKVAEDDFGSEAYGIGFRLGEDAFREEVDKILDEMKEDGTAAEISNEWFGEDILVR